MATICFYQDTRHEKPLYWIQEKLGIGYVSRRNDGMSELRINGFQRVFDVLSSLEPFVRFKQTQVRAMLTATDILRAKKIRVLTERELRRLLDLVFVIQNQNYVTKRKKSKAELHTLFNLTP